MSNNITAESSNSGFVAQVPLDQHPYFTHIDEIKSYGYNQLYTAERFGKKWLLKGLKSDFRQQQFYIELLKKEFDILMSISYPYIVQAFGVELIPDLGPCIIMEYVDGMTLEEMLKKGLTFKQKQKIIHQLLEALQYVHRKQIVHRDLKPANILITHNGGNVKLIDFGLADTDAYRILKQPAGTFRYMSPEQREERQPDIRNDIYSLGRILEDMQLGRRYAKVVRRCLQPLAYRYEDVNALSQSLSEVNKVRNRSIVFGTVAALVLFLGYLTWQVQEIRKNIPVQQLDVQHSSVYSNPVQSSQEGAEAYMDEEKTFECDSLDLAAAINQGMSLLDVYLRSTNFDQHIRGLQHISDLDHNRYLEVATQASEIIENYMKKIEDGYSFEQRRYIHEQISSHFADDYLNKWNAQVEELTNEKKHHIGRL